MAIHQTLLDGRHLDMDLGFVAELLDHADFTAQAVFGCFYLGALAVALPAWWLLGKPQYPTSGLQWGILLWLGVGASGLGYFLWNKGATLVSSGVLAIMNNALIPAGLLVNLLLWGKDTDLTRLTMGGLLMLASLWICQRAGVSKH